MGFFPATKKGQNILHDDINIKCLAEEARFTQEETKHWLQHLYEVKARWNQGAKKAVTTRKADKGKCFNICTKHVKLMELPLKMQYQKESGSVQHVKVSSDVVRNLKNCVVSMTINSVCYFL